MLLDLRRAVGRNGEAGSLRQFAIEVLSSAPE
jgi:hypothetical protein